MKNRQHTVVAGDSTKGIETKYHVPWATIAAHPANSFLKTRKGYPLHPGDQITIPDQNQAPSPSQNRSQPQSHTQSPLQPLQDFLRIVEDNLQKLRMSLNLHPARATARTYATKPPEKVPVAVKAVATNEIVGYKKALPKVWSSVTLTASIENAFTVLTAYLPAGVIMTSGYRSDADQARIINDYFADKKGPATIVDVEARRQWLKNQGMIIARVGSSPHRTGLAFDISGGNLDQMDAAVRKCAEEQPTTFPLQGTIIERKQNCLHINLVY
jgi:hypothetical protein